MKKGFSAFIILLIVTVVLISGCSQTAKKSTEPTGEAKIETPVKTTISTPSPTEISISGDSLGTELARSDMIDSDLQDPEFADISSDLSEIESGL